MTFRARALAVLTLAAAVTLAACDPGEDGPAGGAGGAPPTAGASAAPSPSSRERTVPMELGNFCVCLSVKDLATSLAFYQKFGFTQVAGEASQNWVVLRNGMAKIGLFQGHIEKNTLTFNPGWSGDGTPLEAFTDVRELQKTIEASGVALDVRTDPAGTGPAYFVTKDPDGNPILVDQHVPRPAKR